jgi:hypothetical protein
MQQLLLLSYEASATFSETWKTSVTPDEAWVNFWSEAEWTAHTDPLAFCFFLQTGL